MSAYEKLESRFEDIYHLTHVQAIVGWDEAVMMPAGSGVARAKGLSTLHSHIHNMLIDNEVGELIEQAKEQTELTHWQKKNLNLIEKKHLNATLLPTSLVKSLSEANIRCEQQWRICRAENDWKGFLPYMEKSFSLLKESTQIRSQYWGLSSYDVLLDDYVPGFSQATIDPLFTKLEEVLPGLITQIMDRQEKNSIKPQAGKFDIVQQQRLSRYVMKLLGFDFNQGRLDVTHHPFCGGVAEDVRVTTRYDESDFVSSLMAVCHETGHALYEQGLPKQWLSQPVGHALGMAIHESQSLFVEMQLCRSKAFISYMMPQLKSFFPQQALLNENDLYALVTAVKPSLIRVDADEATYPLHVILRYNIEKKLFNEELTIAELPECWDYYMQQYLGLSTCEDDANGVLQDVHWPSGAYGYFPSYTLGRMFAAQMYQSMLVDIPDTENHISTGDFFSIVRWLREHVHSKASSLESGDLIKKVTGKELSADDFLHHIKNRYCEQ